VAGFTVRTELLGVTSIVRALKLRPKCYDTLLDNMHSSASRISTTILQSRRLAYSRMARSCIGSVCWSWVETRA
jgi:hypothetical protein